MSAPTDDERESVPGLLAAGVRVEDVLDQLPATIGIFTGPDLVVAYANPLYAALAGDRELVGRPVAEVFDEPQNARVVEALRRCYESGELVRGQEWAGVAPDPRTGRPRAVWFDFAYVPLRAADGQVVGAMVHAMEVTELVEARRGAEESERRLRLLTNAGVVGVVTSDERGIVEANDAFLALVGRTREELEAGALTWDAISPRDSLEATQRAIDEARTTGRAGPFEKEYVRPDGVRVPVIVSAVALQDRPYLAMGFVMDDSARRAAEAERERVLEAEREARRVAEVALDRLALLQRATAQLAAAVSAAEVGEITVAQATEALAADGGSLGLVDGDDIVLVHDRGYRRPAAEAWRRRPLAHASPVSHALLRLTPVWLERREDWEPWPELAHTIESFEALACVPLVAAGRALGALALSFRRSRVLDQGERAFLLALADLAAHALDRARLYEERAYVARTLQAGLLPDTVVAPPGLEVAVRYHSIADGGEVGGDFYDFFETAPDGWLAAVGDVAGKGSAAAVLTGLSRHTLRAIAATEARPVAMLAFLNEALRRQATDAAFCTVGAVALSPVDGGFTARMAFGGHPYPLLVRAGATVAEEVPVRGTLLGVERDPVLEEVTVGLGPGDVLVLRTDGVEDARDPDGQRFGEERVIEAVGAAAAGGARAEAVAEAIDAAVAAHERGGPLRDDRAIVVLRVAR
jgi:PAS domain S-box-containing protein